VSDEDAKSKARSIQVVIPMHPNADYSPEGLERSRKEFEEVNTPEAVSFYRNGIIPELFFRMVKTVIVPAMVKQYMEEREKKMRQAKQEEKAEKKTRKTRSPKKKATMKSERDISDSPRHS
jgi:hypothetical protein